MRSTSGAASSLMSTLILVSHAAFAPFVPHARIISFLSGHAIKISQQSHVSRPAPMYRPVGNQPRARMNVLKLIIYE